jgi:hypothetical protein
MTNPYPPQVVRWRVKDILEAHGKSVYALSDAMHGKISRNTLYKISRNETDRTDLKTLEVLSEGISAFIGKRVGIGDLFDVTPDEAPK